MVVREEAAGEEAKSETGEKSEGGRGFDKDSVGGGENGNGKPRVRWEGGGDSEGEGVEKDLKAKVVSHRQGMGTTGSHTEYVIVCQLGDVKWQAFKRYSDFTTLHERLGPRVAAKVWS